MQNANGIQSLNYMHKALMAGICVFAGVAFYLVYSNAMPPSMQHKDRLLQIIVLVITAAGFFIGSFLFKKKILAIRDMRNVPQDKFNAYRAACLTQWALLELPALFSIVCFYLVGNYAYLALVGILLLIFAMLAPTKQKVALQIGLTDEEVNNL